MLPPCSANATTRQPLLVGTQSSTALSVSWAGLRLAMPAPCSSSIRSIGTTCRSSRAGRQWWTQRHLRSEHSSWRWMTRPQSLAALPVSHILHRLRHARASRLRAFRGRPRQETSANQRLAHIIRRKSKARRLIRGSYPPISRAGRCIPCWRAFPLGGRSCSARPTSCGSRAAVSAAISSITR